MIKYSYISFAKLAFLKTGLMKEIGFRTFSQEDLNNNNQFVITHNKITKIVKATLYNPAGIEIATQGIFSIIDINNCLLSFGQSIDSGQWLIILEFIFE